MERDGNRNADQSLRVSVNGRNVQNVMLDKTPPAKHPAIGLSRYLGRVGFLKRKGEVRFRNIEIKELLPEKAIGAAANNDGLAAARRATRGGKR